MPKQSKLGVYFLAHFSSKEGSFASVSAEEHSDPNLTSGPTEDSLGSTQGATPRETAGAVIGHYHLLEKIGEGGAMNPETRPLFLRCTADGKRFLMTTNSEASEGESAPVTVVLNWAAGLKK